MKLWNIFAVALLSGSALASPAAPAVTQAPDINKRATTCTFTGSNGAASASASQKSCSTIVLSDVAVPSGVTLDLSDLPDGTHVIFEGTTTWGYEEWSGPLLQISGNDITVTGASGATLNPDGARWWDGKGTSGTTKPKFFYAHSLSSSQINNLHILNTPLMAVSISGCDGLNITDMTIDDSAGDSAGGHNTDGFDIGDSSNVIISGAKVYNQDDCVAINSGTGITFTGGLCSGGHGLSIGSVGGRSDNLVKTVKFLDSQVQNSVQAIRIKTVAGATGSVSGVTYSGITMKSISSYGILIEQNYNGGDLKGDPTSGVPITDLTVSNIIGTGSVSSSGYNIVIVCGTTGCSNWTWSKVAVTGGKDYGNCTNVPSAATCST